MYSYREKGLASDKKVYDSMLKIIKYIPGKNIEVVQI